MTGWYVAQSAKSELLKSSPRLPFVALTSSLSQTSPQPWQTSMQSQRTSQNITIPPLTIACTVETFPDFMYVAIGSWSAPILPPSGLTLPPIQRDNSMLTFEGDQFLGVAPITEKLVVWISAVASDPLIIWHPMQTLAFTTVVHAITTLDAQPFPGGLVVLVTGQLKVCAGCSISDGDSNLHIGWYRRTCNRFHPSLYFDPGWRFLLCVSFRTSFPYLSLKSALRFNDLFRLNYG